MSNKKNIVFKSVEEYNKKFRNGRHNLLSFSKSEVEQFDKKNSTNKKDYLLEGRKWTLIGDKYYEIPRTPRLVWFRNLNTGVKIITSVLLTGGVASAVAIPTLMFTVWNKGVEYTVTFDTDGGTKIPSQKIQSNETAIEPQNPTKQDLEYNYIFKEWQLDGEKFVFSTPITHDITLKAKYNDNPVLWYSDPTYTSGLQSTDVGLIRGVTVNNQLHKVRLIGIDHDEDANRNKLHTTWEFANLISDKDGYSLAYQWNDKQKSTYSNYDYTNSTIRYALTGQGTNGGKSGLKEGEILAAQKNETTWSTTYGDKTILSMLPEDLTNNLKIVKKSVGVYNERSNEFVETSYTDKLFMLSSIEMGYYDSYDKGFGTTYSYYRGHTGATDAIRIKNQVKSEEPFGRSSIIKKGTKQTYEGDVYNFAGYNQHSGGYYYLRSFNATDTGAMVLCEYSGHLVPWTGCIYSLGIAPAFCL